MRLRPVHALMIAATAAVGACAGGPEVAQGPANPGYLGIETILLDGEMVMLGAYIQATGALKMETIEEMLASVFTGPKAHLVELNIRALKAGADYVR